MVPMETSPLLARASCQSKYPAAWHDFVDLSSMAAQVSMATLARAALLAIDSIFLGHLGVKELAAASLAQLWTSPALYAVWASASALNTLCGQSWGAGNRELTGVWLQFGLMITAALSVPVTIWYWCVGCVLKYSTDDQEVIAFATTFSRVISGSILPTLLYCCLRQYLQAMGILLPTTIVGIVSIIVAAGSNSVLIYGIGPWHGLGFVGSPIATVVASWFQPLALFSYAILYKHYHHRAWFGWNIHALTLRRLRSYLTVAGPISSNSFVSNLANALVALVAAKLGYRVIAANAVISGLWSLLWAFFWGYGCATQIRVANYLGAGKPDLARRITGLGFICTMGVVVIIATVTSLLDDRIIALFTTDKELLTTCKLVLPVFVVACGFEAMETLGAGALTGMSQVHTVFWTSAIATWLINLPVAYIGGITLNYGFPALWVGVLSMELFKVMSYSLALIRVEWNQMAECVMKAAEVVPEIEQSTARCMAAVADIQPTTPNTTPPLLASLLERHRRRRSEEGHFNMGLMSSVRPLNGQLIKMTLEMGDPNDEAPLGKWAQRKEARRNMYATSTENVRVQRRGIGSSSVSSAAAMCQKCLRPGHWTYECKNEAVYVQRPSRSQQLKNPTLRQPFNKDRPPELEEKEAKTSVADKSKTLKHQVKKDSDKVKKKRMNSQRKRHCSDSSSNSSSESPSSSSGSSVSDSSGSSSSSSDSSSSESESSSSSSDNRRKHRLKRRRRD